MHILFYMSDT